MILSSMRVCERGECSMRDIKAPGQRDVARAIVKQKPAAPPLARHRLRTNSGPQTSNELSRFRSVVCVPFESTVQTRIDEGRRGSSAVPQPCWKEWRERKTWLPTPQRNKFVWIALPHRQKGRPVFTGTKSATKKRPHAKSAPGKSSQIS